MILTLLLTGSLLAAEEQWIQVVYAKDAKTVAPDFLKRVKESGYPYRLIKKDGSLKIWMGSFDDLEKAESALPLIRCRVTPDAFIVKAKEPAAIGVYTPMKSVEKKVDRPAKLVKKAKVEKEEKVGPVKKVVKQAPASCSCDKRAIHVAELASAIAFYRNSPYHRFLMPESSSVE